jgi:hypothetical protein
MSFELRGSDEPQLQDEYFLFNPTNGYLYKANYKGMNRDKMLALQQRYVSAGIECELGYLKGGNCQLNIVDATQQFTIDTWEIVGNKLNIDGFSHPTVKSICSDDQVAAMRNGIQNLTGGVPTAAAIATIFTDAIFASISGANKIVLSRFIGLQLRGSTDYRRGQYVLRHTTNAPGRSYAQNVSDINVDDIYLTTSVLTEVRNANLWAFPLPDRLYAKINAIVPLPSQPFYQWGWLKDASTEQTAPYNRVNISTDYTLELFSTDYYPNVV